MDAVIAARVDSRLLATRSSSIYVKNQSARLFLFVFSAVSFTWVPLWNLRDYGFLFHRPVYKKFIGVPGLKYNKTQSSLFASELSDMGTHV